LAVGNGCAPLISLFFAGEGDLYGMPADIRYSAMDQIGEVPAIGLANGIGELSTANGFSVEVPFSPSEQVVTSLAKVLEQRDSHTAGHCGRLAITAVAMGVAMRLDGPSLLALYLGGVLHDVGKIGIPDAILFKPGQLNDEEWEIMRSHSVRGEEICRPLRSLQCALPIIRHHHERWDGSGYPDGLAGAAIPLLARVVQAADIYDALTNPRPYKHAFSAVRALKVLEEETARGWRDPDVIALFIGMHRRMILKIDACRAGTPEGSTMHESFAHLREFLAQ
jgi:putative two-component system response regulator